jgi:ankyrin repeat protein
LFNAVYANDFEIVKFLLEKGCNPNSHGIATSPLITSIYTQNTDIIEILIKYGAINNSVEVLDCAKRTFNKKVQKIFTNLGFVL